MAEHRVRLVQAVARPTVVVAGATTWEDFPSTWRSMLDDVYAAVRPGHDAGAAGGGGAGRWQNVMLYKDDVPNVEVGVLASGPFSATGAVITSVLPGGATAVTMHRGPYEDLGAAHRAVRDWCREHGHALAGPFWEIYGHWTEDPRELETEVSYLVR